MLFESGIFFVSLAAQPGKERSIQLETRSGFLISQVKQMQGRVFTRLLQDSGVEEFNGPQGHILYVLWQSDGVPIMEISRKTGLAKNTLTVMLERMEKNGLVCRRQSENDRRQTLIALTDKARGLKEKYDEVSQRMNDLFFQGFEPEEINRLESYLDRIVENLKKEEQTNGKNKRNGHQQ